MISCGWIFPDGTEYDLDEELRGHYLVFEHFFNWLQGTDEALYNQILNEMNDPHWLMNIDCYAIMRLGWIRVGHADRMVVECAGFSFQEEYIRPYEEANWIIESEGMSDKYFIKINGKLPF